MSYRNLVSLLVGVAVFIVIVLVAFVVIGFGVSAVSLGECHGLSVALVKAEDKSDVTINKKVAEVANTALEEKDNEVKDLKKDLKKAETDKVEALKDQLENSNRELEKVREKLSRKPEVVLVPTAVPTACAIPTPASALVEYVPTTPGVMVEPAAPEVHRQIVGGPRGGQNPRTWQEAIGMFLAAANAKGDALGAKAFRAALDHRLDQGQKSFLRELSNRVGSQDRVYIQQALQNSR